MVMCVPTYFPRLMTVKEDDLSVLLRPEHGFGITTATVTAIATAATAVSTAIAALVTTVLAAMTVNALAQQTSGSSDTGAV